MMAGDWPRAACSGREAAGRKLGLIGFGGIAQETARLARAMGMQVCASDPFVPAGSPAWDGVERMDQAGVLASADAVSLHVPLVAETKHLINAETLKTMKPDAVLINAARGGVVDDTALAEALREGVSSGAALDVFTVEPLPANHKLWAYENVIITPHCSSVYQGWDLKSVEMFSENLMRYRKGEALSNIVNPERGY
jgi:(S)-sulfolactate dehydrogenase